MQINFNKSLTAHHMEIVSVESPTKINVVVTNGDQKIDGVCNRLITGYWTLTMSDELYPTLLADIRAMGVAHEPSAKTVKWGISPEAEAVLDSLRPTAATAEAPRDYEAEYAAGAAKIAERKAAIMARCTAPIAITTDEAIAKARETGKRVLLKLGEIEMVSNGRSEAVGRVNTYACPNGEIKQVIEASDFE